MGDFSIGNAIGAGFRLIGRHPLAVLAWMATYLVIGVLPHLAVMAMILPEWMRMTQEIASSSIGRDPMGTAEMMRAQMGMMQLQPLAWLAGVVSQAILLGAIYRAVLFPDERDFFYLRVSGRELWLGLVLLVIIVMAILLGVAMLVPVGIVTGILAMLARDTPALGVIAVPIVFAAMAVFFWVLLRLSLATPMSFREHTFRLYESWSLTRGQAGKIFLVALVLVIIVWIGEMVLAAIGFIALGGIVGLQAFAQWVQHPHFDPQAALPWIVGGSAALAIFSTLILVLFGAAWAEIYRELSGPDLESTAVA